MARAAQGDRNRRGGRRARSADRGQRDPERDAPGCAGPDRARLRARDDGLSALSSEPARHAPRGAGRGLDGALHPPAHAADARHGGRDRPGRGQRGAEILPFSRRGRTAGNRDRRRGAGRAAAARELRRARRGRFRQRQSGEEPVHAILLRRRLRRVAPGRCDGRQLHVRRQAHRKPLRAHSGELRPRPDAAARRRGGQLRRLRAPRRPAAHPVDAAEGARTRRAAALRLAVRGLPRRSAPAQLPHDSVPDSLMPAPGKSPQSSSGPAQVLSLGDATAIIVGLIIGAGIFGTPAIVAGAVGSPARMVAAWIAGGVFSVIGALCYAELATAYPSAAGQPWYFGAGIGSAMVFVLFTYGGWNDAAYISAEVRDPRRNMVRALLYSIGLVTLLYVLVNVAYMKGLGYDAMARSDAVAADLLKRVWGPAGEKLISIMIAIAALTSVNGSMIVGARSNYALGRDWPTFRFLARWDEASGSPRAAMLVQGVIAFVLVVFGAIRNSGFKGLVEYSLPVFWGFFLLVGVGLFVLRAREPDTPRPFRVPGYPVVPALFVAMCAYLLYASLVYHREHALVGLGVLAVGAAVMLFGNRGQTTGSGAKP